MNYSIFNVCSCSNMISVAGFINLLEKREIGSRNIGKGGTNISTIFNKE